MVHVGDRILFSQNDRNIEVANGQFGIVKGFNSLTKRFTVEMDGGKTVSFFERDYSAISLGYAVTVHKAQGMTVENAYVMAGGRMQDREMSYVAMSRAKEKTRVYAQGEDAEQAVKGLGEQMGRSNEKRLASELVQRHQPEVKPPAPRVEPRQLGM